MPALDPIQHAPMKDGPTQLQAPMRALPRSEPFQLKATKAPPLHMPTKPRPLTSKVVHQMEAAPAVALTRTSNINPDAAGQDNRTSIWGVSGMGAEGSEGAQEGPGLVQRLAIPATVGIVVGLLLARR